MAFVPIVRAMTGPVQVHAAVRHQGRVHHAVRRVMPPHVRTRRLKDDTGRRLKDDARAHRAKRWHQEGPFPILGSRLAAEITIHGCDGVLRFSVWP